MSDPATTSAGWWSLSKMRDEPTHTASIAGPSAASCGHQVVIRGRLRGHHTTSGLALLTILSSVRSTWQLGGSISLPRGERGPAPAWLGRAAPRRRSDTWRSAAMLAPAWPEGKERT